MSGIPILTFKQTNQPLLHTTILKQSTCYTVTTDTQQWYRINTKEITDNHNTAISNDTRMNMGLLPPAELPEINTFETFARLLLSQNQRDLPNNI